MTENDIYNSKKQYETALKKLEDGTYLKKPTKKGDLYYIVNPSNQKYFKLLIKEFEFRDLSYMRRNGLFKCLRRTTYFIEQKDLKDLTREDVKDLVTKVRQRLNDVSFRDWFDKMKFIAKVLFPEMDSQGRPIDDVVPYSWRIKIKIDPSRKSDRKDKFTDTQYIKIQRSMNRNPMYQLWFSLLYLNLARPGALCWVDTSDVEIKDNYARIRIPGHAKEGPITLQLIDNYFYLVRWLEQHQLYDAKHPDKKGIPLFLSQSNNARNKRLTPKAGNKFIQSKLKELGIDVQLSNYSFKRNGVTHRRIRGDSDSDTQKIAGWKNPKQIMTYDISEQEDFLQKELQEKGIIKAGDKQSKVSYKVCAFCNAISPVSASRCTKCQRSLDRDKILKEEEEKDKKVEMLETQMAEMNKILQAIQNDKKITKK